MNRWFNRTILLLLASILLIPNNNIFSKGVIDSHGEVINSPTSLSQIKFFKVDLQITAPTGSSIPKFTPIVINLSTLAQEFPSSADPFGLDTPETADDIKWQSSYVIFNDTLIPSQVDDLDNQVGYSASDELVFQFPEDLELASEESATFSIYLGNLEADLPVPAFEEKCIIYEYPKIDLVTQYFGPEMLHEAYYLESNWIQMCALVDSAWSSGGMYELSILNESGQSQWDAVKRRRQMNTFAWQWSRFANIEQFIEWNDAAGSNAFFLPDPSRSSLISGPVRGRIQMQSIPPYGKPSSPWGSKTGVYGLLTYDLFANVPYVDYTLDTTGINASLYPTLMIELQNRDIAPGGLGCPYKSFYVPGVGWVDRVPDDLLKHAVQSSSITDPWYLEKLAPGETMNPNEPDADKLGFGFIFEKEGLANLTYSKTSEEIKTIYSACELPLKARYFPIDVTITSNAVTYMQQEYSKWVTKPEIVIDISETTILPFDYISVSQPIVMPIWAKVGDTINISKITANISTIGPINDSITSTHIYEILDYETNANVSTGDLEWDNESSFWEAINVGLSGLTEDKFYTVRAKFGYDTLEGKSKPSTKFWYGNSNPPIDLTPPRISDILQSPLLSAIIRSTDTVIVSCRVTDESGVHNVTLQYNNGTWYKVLMELQSGFYFGSIPAQKPGKTVQYKITAIDNSPQQNVNNTKVYSYVVALEYQPGQGIIPLIGISGVIIVAVVVALRAAAMHRQKYDQI